MGMVVTFSLRLFLFNFRILKSEFLEPPFNAFALSGRHYISSCEPRVSLRLPWAMSSIGPSARPC